MLLKNLIKNIPKEKKNTLISGLSSNSIETKKNFIFFAIRGNRVNGEKFINEAVKKGAVVIVCSTKCQAKVKNKKITIIKVNNVRNFLSEIAAKFYKSKPKNIIAVTGTNGKTSVADIFYQILRLNNLPAATIGTLGIKFNNKILKTDLTSPDTISLHKNLNYLKKNKINNVIVEASSHGLAQQRLHNIKFKAGIFTNFSQDHLDYHKNMQSYLNSKLILFREILKKKNTIISDKAIRPFFILKRTAKRKKLKLLDISKKIDKVKNIFSHHTNDFKIKNLIMAIEAAKLCGLKEHFIFKKLNKLKDVDGRLELVRKYSNGVKVFVDFAHTPDALEKTLKSLRDLYGNNISLVFGCGGDRDKKKRSLMGKIANKICKKVYITDDNPRKEDPRKIRIAISKNISKNKLFNIGNRSLAIKKAIHSANPDEIILIAGKGHEQQQIYKDKIIKISDKKIVKKIKKRFKKLNKKEHNFYQNKLILKQILGKEKKLNFNGVSIDTRSMQKDNLFLAIKGKKNDGNNFIKIALKKGAGCAVSSNVKIKGNKKIIKVQNTISFLNNFAKFKRGLTQAKIIAVTGSVGKTSLKNLIKDLLQNVGKTYSSPRSFNNHLGVPISLSNLGFDDKFGVFEVGMSKAGEIKNLTKLLKPDIGVITNIGEAHLENFKNKRGIAEAKSEIIENIQPGGTIILNRDDKFFKYLSQKAKMCKLKISTFGKHKNANVRIQKISNDGLKTKIFVNCQDQIINFEVKDLNIYNVLASIVVLKELKINLLKIKDKFKKFGLIEGRGKKHSILRYQKKFKLIDESYNANPLSVNNAIKNLSSIKKNSFKKYLILGDMLELGPRSKKYHEDLSKVINKSDIDKVFIKGKKTLFTYKHINKKKRGNILQNNEDIDLSLSKVISHNDYLMIKGSNATGLNEFSKKMIKGL